jgi:hypothetical protein
MRERRALEHANAPVRVRLMDMRVPVTSERDGAWESPWGVGGGGGGGGGETWRDGKMWEGRASAAADFDGDELDLVVAPARV